MKTKACFIGWSMLVMVSSASAQTIAVETQSPHFFYNVVLDSFFLMDRGLQEVLAPDFERLVEKASFTPQPNSWIPKPHPKGVISNIYNRISANNLGESFTTMVSKVVELACTSPQYDPLSSLSSKCVSKILKYPIIEPIQIKYNYNKGKTFDQFVSNLSNSTDADRYQNIVVALADLMNSGYERSSNTNITKQLHFVKYPLPMVASVRPTSASGGLSGMTEADIKNEMMRLNLALDGTRIACTDVKLNQRERKACDNELKELRTQIELLNSNPSSYLAYKEQLAVKEMSKNQVTNSRRNERYDGVGDEKSRNQQQYFTTDGGMMTQPPGSDFAITSKGDTYYKPQGSAFSYGTGQNAGKTCFHYGAFADCK